MIDITEVKMVEESAIEDRIAEQRKTEKKNIAYYDNQRKLAFLKMEEGRAMAEKRFPYQMLQIESAIKTVIGRNNTRSIRINCVGEGSWDLHFLKLMIVQAMPLNGFICEFCEDIRFVEISW